MFIVSIVPPEALKLISMKFLFLKTPLSKVGDLYSEAIGLYRTSIDKESKVPTLVVFPDFWINKWVVFDVWFILFRLVERQVLCCLSFVSPVSFEPHWTQEFVK